MMSGLEDMFGNVPPACVVAEFLSTLLFQFFGGACAANSHYRAQKNGKLDSEKSHAPRCAGESRKLSWFDSCHGPQLGL